MAILAGCASQNLPASYELSSAKGVLYSKMNELDGQLYCTFAFFKKEVSQFTFDSCEKDAYCKKKTHTVNRSMLDKRETLIVMEMDPGIWVFRGFELSQHFYDRSYYYRIGDDLGIEFEIKPGSVNYMPFINIDTDCDIPMFSWGGPALGRCSTYTIEFHDKRQEIDAELTKEFPNLKRSDDKENCLSEKNQTDFRRTGVFREPSVVWHPPDGPDDLP
jgi:hypothetical protein